MTPIHTTKKVLIAFGNLGIGGLQTKIVSISKYLQLSRGDRILVHLVLRDTPAFNLEHQINLSNVIIHHKPQFRFGFIHVPFTLYYPWKVITIRPDVILSFFDYLSSLSVISSRFLFWKKIRVVLNEDILSSAQSQSFFHKLLIRTFYPLADCVIVPTRAIRKDLTTRFGISKTKIAIIANWTLMSQGAHSTHKPFDLLYVGRLEKQKNLRFLLRAMKRLTQWRAGVNLYVVGEGPEKTKAQDYIGRHRLSRNVFLFDSNHHISEYLDKSKLFVLCSHFEGMPVALLESMARNLPAVIMRYPGASECLLDGKTGYITDTMEEFVEKIQFLLTHPILRNRMGSNAGLLVRQYFSENSLRRYVNTLIR